MFKNILWSSIQYVANNPTIIRIAFLTGFAESVLIFYRFWYFFYVFLSKNFEMPNLEWSLGEYGIAIFESITTNVSFWLIVFLIIFAVFRYAILFPIGRGMIVNYLETWSVSKSFTKTISRYFTITITQWILAIITFWSWHLRALRYFYSRGIMGNVLVQILLILVFGFIVVTSFLYPYATIASVLDNFTSTKPVQKSREALGHSAKIALDNPLITMKFLVLSLLLLIRFVLVALLALGLPILVIRLFLQIWLINTGSIVVVVSILAGVLLLAGIYINAIVDAVFVTFWYKLYKKLKSD